MSVFHPLFRLLDRVVPARVAHAHCDIPCGIYDPHHAQVAAHTVLRMIDLIEQLPKPGSGDGPEAWDAYASKVARHTLVKEQHAELCKHEVRIIWGDYLKPEHVERFPELHDLVWKIMKLASKGRQELDRKAATELLDAVNRFAEIFWQTKGLEATRGKAPYPTEASLVVPKLA